MPAKYYSANPEKGVVSRFGTSTRDSGNVLIGATRDSKDPRRLVFTDEVVLIPEGEFRRYAREYIRAEKNGSLVSRTEAEYRAWLERTSIVTEGEAVEAPVDVPAEAPAKSKAKSRKDS